MPGDPRQPEAHGNRRDRCLVRPVHAAWQSRPHSFGQRPRVRGLGGPRGDRGRRCHDRPHRAGVPIGERLRRELLCTPTRRVAQWRVFYTLQEAQIIIESWRAALQRHPSACLSRIQTASTRSVRAGIHRVAGFAPCSGSATLAPRPVPDFVGECFAGMILRRSRMSIAPRTAVSVNCEPVY